MHTLTMSTRLPGPPESQLPFFADAANISRITPPELGFRILTAMPITMRKGTVIDYRIELWGIPLRWRTRIASWDPPHSFSDEQLRGPFKLWHHTHGFTSDGRGGTIMTDFIKFALPWEPLSLVAFPLVGRQLHHIFSYRDQALRTTLGLDPSASPPAIRIVR